MRHVAIPFNCKQFLFHRGYSFNLKSISDTGTHHWWKRKSRRTINCVLHSTRSMKRWDCRKNPRWPVEIKKRYATRSSGNALRTSSNGFIWPKYKKILHFGKKSKTFVTYKTASSDCIERVISQKKRRLYINDSLLRDQLQKFWQKYLESAAAATAAAAR